MEKINLLLSNELSIYYLFGFIGIFLGILDDWRNNKFKHFAWYIQEIIYSMLAILFSLSVCMYLELKKPIPFTVSIIAGLIGSSIIRSLRNNKEEISDKVIDKLTDKVIDKSLKKK